MKFESEGLESRVPTTDEEKASLEAALRWVELYNGNDMAKFVKEAYHPEGKVTLFDGVALPGAEPTISDHGQFIALEEFILNEYPRRRIAVRRSVPAGSVVTLECLLVDDARPEFQLAWCVVLTIRDGQVFSDHSYLNHRDWPGALKALGIE